MALNPQFDQLLPSVSALAREAGALAMRWFRPGARTTARVWSKEGDSPVTEADVALDRLLEDRLGALAPDIGWLSEEAERHPENGSDAPAWIVDPIDGTRAFLSGDPIWAVSIALTEGGRPRIAALYLPAVDRLYAAVAGGGAFVDGERIAPGAPAPRLVAGPRMLLDRLLTHVEGFAAHPKVPSLAARIAMVADRRLAAAIASDGAREWDLAAADLVVAEAGGRLTDLRGHAIRYDASPRRHGVLLASAGADHDALMTAAGAAIAARPSS
ncbi:MAG: hypothetical protein BGP06_16590 [Rhizobiales bacterium 65-9]|nr:3'(2'),5'-bisphosphate nucleotidase CysQ [Hyphomicrobiales bacterium]OJY38073.1 MAG: hypothetical protein BGP06_16590 [Rhizobiales bacterium 65-9]